MSKVVEDCLCNSNQNHEGILQFLKSVVIILKNCSAYPILYDKTHQTHDGIEEKYKAWEKIISVYAAFIVDDTRDCTNECTLRGLMRKIRKYFQIIAGQRKVPKISRHEAQTNGEIDNEAIVDGLVVIGQILEMISLHPLLYDSRNMDYKNEIKALAVWNHICAIAVDDDHVRVSYDFNSRFTECMLQRLAKPIIFAGDATSSTTSIYNITCNGTVNIRTAAPEVSITDHPRSTIKLSTNRENSFEIHDEKSCNNNEKIVQQISTKPDP